MLQYMIFMLMRSTAKVFESVPVKHSKKIKLVGFVTADNSIEACEKASESYDVDVSLLTACLIGVGEFTSKMIIHRHDPSVTGVQHFNLGKVSSKVRDELGIPDDIDRIGLYPC